MFAKKLQAFVVNHNRFTTKEQKVLLTAKNEEALVTLASDMDMDIKNVFKNFSYS